MQTTHETINAFYESIASRDFDRLRHLLRDDLDFDGPIAHGRGAQGFIAAQTLMSALTKGVDVKHLFVDGEHACCVFDLITATPIGASPVAEYFEVRDGRIAAIRSHYDARPWFALSGTVRR